MRRVPSWKWVLVSLFVLSVLPGQVLAQVYETYTLKNNSEKVANDLHLVITDGSGVAEPIAQARSSAFEDPPDGEGTNTIDWDSGGTVPPGASDRISICNEDHDFFLFQFPGTHFTHDGDPLSTGLVDIKFGMHVDQDGLASLDVESRHGGAVVASIDVYGGNDLANFSIGDRTNPYETPTGRLAFSQSGLLIPAGSSFTIALGPFDPSGYLLTLVDIEPVEDPDATFFQASGFYPEPTEECNPDEDCVPQVERGR